MPGVAPPKRIATTLACLLGAGALAGCGSSAAPTTTKAAVPSLAAGCRASGPADQTVTTPTYVFLLHVGTPEKMIMLTAAQANAQHITTGELMIGGSMTQPSSRGIKGHVTRHHLEVHICSRASGKVVTDAMPTITADPSSGGTPEHIPVMVMQGVTTGSGDLHYGNNVPLRAATSYRIIVKLGAESATFSYTVPRGT